jgi:membrane associated rhomboid family serine protease
MGNSSSLRFSIAVALAFVALIWAIHLVEFALGLDLYRFAVYPRTVSGLTGIALAPMLHGSWAHLVGNTLPLLLLGTLLIYGYPASRWRALAGIWILSGLGVWLFARGSYHLGASGLTHGMFFFLFVGGILRRDRRSAALLMIAFYMYGGMVLTILPFAPDVSFESHFFGALAGGGLAWLLRHRDPKPPRRTYSWESDQGNDDDAECEDPLIGDQWQRDPD